MIQLHQAGFSNAVAAMGTALTLEQLQLLQRRGARRLLVVFDGDGAGRRATGKLIGGLRTALISSGLELAVVGLPWLRPVLLTPLCVGGGEPGFLHPSAPDETCTWFWGRLAS